jgi:hypothetical protein
MGGNQDEDDFTLSEIMIINKSDRVRRKSVKHDNQVDMD